VSRTLQRITEAKPTPAQSIIPAQNTLIEPLHAFGPTQDLNGINRKPLVSQPPLVQPELITGQTNDKYEPEADHIADTIIRMPAAGIQRKTKNTASPDTVGVENRNSTISNVNYQECGDTNYASGTGIGPGMLDDMQQSASGGKSLTLDLRRSFETSFGHSLNDVRIISDAKATQIADQLDARAFTVGNNIWFSHGEFRPDTVDGRRLLAHELAHTVQQGSGSRGLQRDTVIGRNDDPAETEADRVVDAVLKGERAPAIRQRPSVLRREARQSCTVSTASRPDQRIVQCGDQRYRVTFVITSASESETRTSADLGFNDGRIFLNFEICRGGTAVNIRPSIDLPEALVDIVGNLLQGSDALEGVTLSPELRITIVQSRSYSITLSGGPTVEVGSGEVTGGRGGVSVETGAGRFGGEIAGTRERGGRGGVAWTFNIRYTPGDFRPEIRDCSRRRRRLRMRCERLTTIPAVPARPAEMGTLRREVYLLFPYSDSTPIESILIREGSGTPRPPGAGELAALGTEGYRVRSIEGFASPEGPRPPSRRRRFMGNIQLAQSRADEAKRWLMTNCPDCDGASIAPVGRAELFSPGRTPELEGRPLAEEARREFLASADPLRPGTEEARRAMAGEPIPASTRRFEVYRRLRRAVIVLERSVVVRPRRAGRPARVEATGTACPREVREAVRNHLGITIMHM